VGAAGLVKGSNQNSLIHHPSVHRFLVDTLDAADLAWSPDGGKLAVWDSPLAYKVCGSFRAVCAGL